MTKERAEALARWKEELPCFVAACVHLHNPCFYGRGSTKDIEQRAEEWGFKCAQSQDSKTCLGIARVLNRKEPP